MTGLAALAGMLLQLSLEAPAAGRPQPTDARRLEAGDRFQRGAEMFEENNFSGALVEFRRAQSLAPSYKLLYNIGQVCYLLRDYPCALDSFTRYLAEGAGQVPPGRRTEVERDLDRLRARVGRLLVVTEPAGAEVAVDDAVVGKTPLIEPLVVAAGRPRITVTLPGYAPASKVVEVAAMETATIELTLQPLVIAAPPAPIDLSARLPPAPAPPPPGRRTAPVVSWVVTGALAAAAGGAGALALRSAADLKSRRERWVEDGADLRRRSTQVKRLALVTDVLLGSALMAAGVSTLITFTGSRDRKELALRYRF